LTNLIELDLHENEVTDISLLSGFTKLSWLNLRSNKISDISALAKLTNLTVLYLSGNQLTDLSGISNLTNLTHLDLYLNQLSDIGALVDLTNLTWLSLHGNQISNITPLLENTGISGTIKLKNNPLNNTALSTHIPALEARGIKVEYDMPEGVVLFKDANLEKAIRDALGIPTELLKKEDLAKLVELKYEGKDSARISDLTGIEHCTGLKKLNLRNHQITDVSATS